MKAGTKLEARKSARVKLGGAVAVTVRCQGSKRIEARLHEISTTGGVVFLDEAIEERTQVMLVFETPAGLIKESAEIASAALGDQGMSAALSLYGSK